MPAIEPITFRQWGSGARFMPGRASDDNRIAFGGFRYSREAQKTETGFIAGIGIGPEPQKRVDEAADFELLPGGKVVPAVPNADLKTVDVREYTPPGEKRARKYVDWVTFQKYGDQLIRAVPYENDETFFWEVWTGDVLESEAAYQLIQANLFDHGSCAYFGTSAGELMINAPSAVLLDPNAKPFDESRNVRQTQAELVQQRKGLVVAGRPLWLARVWKCRYSPKDSETILVRQYNRFYLLIVQNGKGAYIPIRDDKETVKKYKGRYERLVVDQNLVDLPVAA